MSKQAINLTLVEMYAVKHGLQMQLRCKENDLRAMEGTTIWEENIEAYERLKKDVGHERELVKRFECEIRTFREKNNIK
ncbi:MAG: hypothetical protein E7211_08630 [Clostridium lundense]|nr:hypothetical protein [Clostridium lundense]